MENTQICCMLVGAAGAGNSSFINTLVKELNTSKESGQKLSGFIPTARSRVMGGHTMMREPVKVTDDLIIVGNRGWHDWNNEAALKELSAQIQRPPSVVITHRDAISDEKVKQMTAFLENERIDPAKIFVVKNVTSKEQSLNDKTKACICDYIEMCRDDGQAGALAHKRRENVEEKREKKKALGMEKEILKLQHELKEAEISEAKARLENETETRKEMDSMKEAALKREIESAERLQDMSEANRGKMNDLKLKNQSDMHEHFKNVLKERLKEGQSRKVNSK